jgi:hypothetical protein
VYQAPAQHLPPPPPPPRSRPNLKGILAAVVAIAVAAVPIFIALSSKDEAEAAVVYEPPLAPGPDPFTSPVDVSAAGVGAVIPTPSPEPASTISSPGQTAAPGGTPTTAPGNFGGTGFTTVCDRELLVRQLQANLVALEAWASVHRLGPESVPAYIRSLRPSTLTRDTRVTNHSFKAGKAVPFQSIQPAGTAVLVDDAGRVVARCRCGNPLLEPIPIGSGTCKGCPTGYKPPDLLPRGQVPPVVTALNPPPVTASGPQPTQTATPGATGPIAGTYRPDQASIRVLEGGSECNPNVAEDFTVALDGSTLTFTFPGEDPAQNVAAQGTLGSDGRFQVAYTQGTDRLEMTGRFAGNQMVIERYLFDIDVLGERVRCVYSATAVRL